MKNIKSGVVHNIPRDLKEIIIGSNVLEKWNNLTPLARNEWICWVTSVKLEETRIKHITRLVEEISKGKKRPCCWAGCIHRK